MKPYKELNEYEKKAVDVTLAFWKYAMETGCPSKKDWEQFNKINKYPCACGICFINGQEGTGFPLIGDLCRECFLFNFNGETYCGYWYDWKLAENIKDRKKTAKVIYDKILKYVKGENK